MFDRMSIKEGWTVRSSDGEKLGKVFALGDGEFQIEKGLFFPKDYLCSYADIADVRGHDIILRHGREALRSLDGAASTAGGAGTFGTMGTAATIPTSRRDDAFVGGATGASTGWSADSSAGLSDASRRDSSLDASASLRGEKDLRVPVVEEELDVIKRDREAGQVRVHKTVEVEHREVDVPVRAERVTVERVPVANMRPASDAFREETISVPVHAEDVEVQKRAVVREEVRVKKTAYEQERRVAADIRKEHVDVETEGQVDETTGRTSTTREPGTIGSPDIDPKTRY
jgi:uncharacterized protein (TIGR02271 family)